MQTPEIRLQLRALVLSLLAFLCVVTAVASCGDEDDLIFPGDIPFTATSVNTATPDDEEN